MSASLGSFQIEVWSKLSTLFNGREVQAFDEVIHGRTEDYVKISIDDLTLWLYHDGAGILGPGIDDRFEWQDYQSLNELGAAFLVRVEQLLVNRTDD